MKPYEDPNNPNNGPQHHTGKPCVEHGCTNPAGTAWSPFWCQSCNAKRMNRINDQMGLMEEHLDTILRGPAHASKEEDQA